MRSKTANVIYSNRGLDNGIGGELPDAYQQKPSPKFVLCRNKEGESTAIYGENVWDFNPYRLSDKQINKMRFSETFFCEDNNFRVLLIKEMKFILYQVMYYSGTGRSGKTSASTLVQYYHHLKVLGSFCVDQLENELAGGFTIADVLSNVAYMKAFLGRKDAVESNKKNTSTLLGVLGKIGDKSLGFRPISKEGLDLSRAEDKQHPVIPSRIYVAIMHHFTELLNATHPYRDNIKAMIIQMEDRNYGATVLTQKARRPTPTKLRPTIEEAVVENGLSELFHEKLSAPKSRHAFVSLLTHIQYIAKTIIHIYAGIRDQEAARFKYNCIDEVEYSDAIKDEGGDVIDASRMLSLISTTTKYSGYQMKERWLAPDCVLRAVSVARSIVEGLAHLYKVDVQNCPLFLSPYIIRSAKAAPRASSFTNCGEKGSFTKSSTPDFHITKDDLIELTHTDPDRDFASEERFSVGDLWPVTSHQYRRSLAFYARNSGFVKLPTITTQFKHTCRAMGQYYSRNSELLLPVFSGSYTESQAKKNDTSHIGIEFQMAAPTSAIQLLFSDVFDNGGTLMGGTGSYMEKQKSRIESGEITVHKAKAETIKQAEAGEISYRQTLLGGCTKVGPCDDLLMGEITACLSCPGALIQNEKLEGMLFSLQNQITMYKPDSAEFQLLAEEISALERFKQKKQSKVKAVV